MSTIIVTGAANGLGALIAANLEDQGHFVVKIDKEYGDDVTQGIYPETLAALKTVDVLINCAGVNGIAWFEDLTDELWDRCIGVNAKAIYKCTQSVLPFLRASKGTVLNIVSDAAHRPMRCSTAYNASKGAAYIMTKQLARELGDDDITVFSVSPNKLAGTQMSKYIDSMVPETRGWTEEEAHEYQLNGLMNKEETPPQLVAEFIAFILSSKDRHRFFAGCDIPYGL